MAVLTGTQVQPIWQDGQAERTALIAVRNISAGDTLDLAAYGFSQVKRAVVLATTAAGSAGLTVTASTVVTMPGALAGDAGYVLAFGCAG